MSSAPKCPRTDDSYGLGALVLGHSLRGTGTTRKLVILITPDVSDAMRHRLQKVYDVIQEVNVLDPKDAANLALLARPELAFTLTKLYAWNLTQFQKAVFISADCLVLQNVDNLFDHEELSAVTYVGWPDCFNTGVFVFRPNTDTYTQLIQFALEKGSFDGGDKGLLNQFFPDWKRLSFVYNMVTTAIESPAFKQYGRNVKIVHFLGSIKPWHRTSAAGGSFSPVLGNFLSLWWQAFNISVRGGVESEVPRLGLLVCVPVIMVPVLSPVLKNIGKRWMDFVRRESVRAAMDPHYGAKTNVLIAIMLMIAWLPKARSGTATIPTSKG
ncbi:glycogenin-1-like [Paramacrobiotus metropolitanus]|uniref:glycogenin-1-like n=1 Tax=Paramacrobiotus metropolitanus TaxID=2943436 RepID=UPI002445D984|nr:glycogenin-1-like [Paramacrobiotus metropolitanus]